MSKHIAPGTPTQIAHPGKAALRTAVAYTLATIAFLSLAIPIITEVLGDYLPDAWEAWLTGAAVFLVAVATLITRLMALAKAQNFLAKIGLGTGVEKEHTPRPAAKTKIAYRSDEHTLPGFSQGESS